VKTKPTAIKKSAWLY